MKRYFIALHPVYKLVSLSWLFKVGNWYVVHALEVYKTDEWSNPVLRHTYGSSAESGGRRCFACPLDLCYTKMRHSHHKLHPDTFVVHSHSQAAGQCIFSLILMDHKMLLLISGHAQHWQQLDELNSCIFHWWWSLSDQRESQGCHHAKQAQVSTFHPLILQAHQHHLVSEVLLRPYQNEIVIQEQDQVVDTENSS